MERNKFLVFCFAFVPGAGQMYLGMMKKGLVIMSVFWAVIAVAVMLNLGVLCVFLPIGARESGLQRIYIYAVAHSQTEY